jgi:transposase
LHAHVVVAKCADSLPLYRQEKILARAGLPIDRNTLLELFHRAARELRVIYNRMEGLLPEYELIHADETTLKVQEQEKCRTGWIWVFLAGPMAFYVFSASRSGQTPMRLLGDSDGILQVDGYTGYNEVTTPERRERAGCWAHARRKFWPVLNTDGKALAEWALEQIGQLYKMEYRAEERQIVGSPAHLRLRQECSGCHRPPYRISTGAPKRITLGAANRITSRAPKRIIVGAANRITLRAHSEFIGVADAKEVRCGSSGRNGAAS